MRIFPPAYARQTVKFRGKWEKSVSHQQLGGAVDEGNSAVSRQRTERAIDGKTRGSLPEDMKTK
jgi:hypothetical protein